MFKQISFNLFKKEITNKLITYHVQCNPDIRELSGPENKPLISGFGLFCLGNTGSNLGPEKISLISGLHCICICAKK